MPSERLCFIAEWYQEEAAIVRSFFMTYYVKDNAVEVFDHRNKKTFLRRTIILDLTEKDFFVGSKVTIFGRQYDIVGYADENTRQLLAKYRKKTFMLIKNNAIHHLGKILCALIDSNFSINKGLMVQFTSEQVNRFLGEKNKGNVEISVLMNELISGPSIGFELISANAVKKMVLCSSQSPECAQEKNIKSLVTIFEREDIRNGIFCSQTEEDAIRDLNYFFDAKNGLQVTALLENSTLAIIKPHCIKEGNLGKIIDEITSNGFKITGLRMHLLERINCEEFYEVYRGILPEYIGMCAHLASGVCMGLEIVHVNESENSFEKFRGFCGPMDPEVAKLLRPHTLRSKFGLSKTLNAIHCTDLEEDTVIELQYIFKII